MKRQSFPQVWAGKITSLLHTAQQNMIYYLDGLADDRDRPRAAKKAIRETERLFYEIRTIVDSALREWETPPAETDECPGCPICD